MSLWAFASSDFTVPFCCAWPWSHLCTCTNYASAAELAGSAQGGPGHCWMCSSSLGSSLLALLPSSHHTLINAQDLSLNLFSKISESLCCTMVKSSTLAGFESWYWHYQHPGSRSELQLCLQVVEITIALHKVIVGIKLDSARKT